MNSSFIGLFLGCAFLFIVVTCIVLWQKGVFNGRAPSPSVSSPSVSSPSTQYTTGPANVSLLTDLMNVKWGAIINCPSWFQRISVWLDSQGIIAVPEGTSCPLNAPVYNPPILNQRIATCFPQNVPLSTISAMSIMSNTSMEGCPPASAPLV
jgi:hypothetical protein